MIPAGVSTAINVVPARATELRSGSISGPVLTTLYPGTKVSAVTAGAPLGWAFVNAGTVTGFVKAVDLNPVAGPSTAQLALNVAGNLVWNSMGNKIAPPLVQTSSSSGFPTWAMILAGAAIGYVILRRR